MTPITAHLHPPLPVMEAPARHWLHHLIQPRLQRRIELACKKPFIKFKHNMTWLRNINTSQLDIIIGIALTVYITGMQNSNRSSGRDFFCLAVIYPVSTDLASQTLLRYNSLLLQWRGQVFNPSGFYTMYTTFCGVTVLRIFFLLKFGPFSGLTMYTKFCGIFLII